MLQCCRVTLEFSLCHEKQIMKFSITGYTNFFNEIVFCVSMLDQGKNVHITDLYASPTWLPPHNCDPMASLPVSMPHVYLIYGILAFNNIHIKSFIVFMLSIFKSHAHQKDAILIPLWTPGHFQICVSICT